MAATIQFVKGDTVTVQLTCQTGTNGSAFNLTGATLETHLIADPGDAEITIPNSQHTVTNAASGQFTVTLSAAVTAQLLSGKGLPVLTKITQGAQITQFRADGILNVLSNRLSAG